MPVHWGSDASGSFYQYGTHGKKYYYTPGDVQSELAARRAAGRQAQAVHAHRGW